MDLGDFEERRDAGDFIENGEKLEHWAAAERLG